MSMSISIMAHIAALYIAWSIVTLNSTLLVPVQSVWKKNFFSVITIIVVFVIVIVIIIREDIISKKLFCMKKSQGRGQLNH